MHEPTSLQAAHPAAASPPAPVLLFSLRSVAGRTAAAALVVGLGAALFYARAGLTLAHYDARGHLVVARRIVDSLTPGWQQRVYEKFKDAFPPAALVFYINHLAWELDKKADYYQPA